MKPLDFEKEELNKWKEELTAEKKDIFDKTSRLRQVVERIELRRKFIEKTPFKDKYKNEFNTVLNGRRAELHNLEIGGKERLEEINCLLVQIEEYLKN